MLKALVIVPNEKTKEIGSLLAVARAEACRCETTNVNPPVKALVFFAELGVYVAVYEVLGTGKVVNKNLAIGKIDNQKATTEKSKGDVG